MSMYQHFEQVCNILNIDVNQLFEGAILGKLLVNQISQDTKDEITNILTNGIRLNERMSRNRLLKCNYFKKLNQIMNCQEPEEIVKPEETIENEEEPEETIQNEPIQNEPIIEQNGGFSEDVIEESTTNTITNTTTKKKRKRKKKQLLTPLIEITELNNIHDLQGYKLCDFKNFLKIKKLSLKGNKGVLKDRVYRFITNPESITEEDKSKRGRKKKIKNTTQSISEETQNAMNFMNEQNTTIENTTIENEKIKQLFDSDSNDDDNETDVETDIENLGYEFYVE